MSQDAKDDLAEVPAGDRLSGEADPYGWVERAVWTERMMECLRKGGPEGGGVWFSLHDKIFTEKTLRAAYARVARNQGAPGVDGMTVEAFGERLDEEIGRLLASWKAGTYRPQAVRRTWIDKPGSAEKRPLGIPTVRDRVVQAAMMLLLGPIFEGTFSDCSHGYRPGRNARGAMDQLWRHLTSGKMWVVDADLKGYFDSIPHERLLEKVRRKIADRKVLALIEAFLKAGILEGDTCSEPDEGTPQGGVISPLLANIYLTDLDRMLEQAGVAMVRYADDFVILCETQGEAERALEMVRAWTEPAGLTLHPTKTRIVDMAQHRASFDFLGYRIQRDTGKDGHARFLRLVRPKSLDKIKEAVRSMTPRKMARSLADTVQRLSVTLRGWFAHFRSAHRTVHHELDGMIRRRLRSQLCKANRICCWGKGSAQGRWPNAFFAAAGLFSLEVAHTAYLHAHRGHTNGRAVCGKSARTVLREGRPG